MTEDASSSCQFDLFLSYSSLDAEQVEELASRLEDEEGLKVWLDRWIIIPGQLFQSEMAQGLDQAKCCVVCIGEKTPSGWFEQEIQKALGRQAKDPLFRVMPLLLPGSNTENVAGFLELRSWIDFRED